MQDEKSTIIRDEERAQASVSLTAYLLKFAPYCVAGGAIAGVIPWLSSDRSMTFLFSSIAVFSFAGLLLGLPLGAFKWWASRRPTNLTAQQQMFAAMGQWRLRVAISAIVSGLLLVAQVVNPVPGGSTSSTIGATLAVFVIFFLVSSAFAFVLRVMKLMPPEAKQDL